MAVMIKKVKNLKEILNRQKSKRASIKQELNYKSRLGLQWKKPVGIEASLELISAVIPYIEIWAYRRNYALFELAMMNIQNVWPFVAKHVVDSAGVTLQDMKEEDLTMELIIDATGVFCRGLLKEKMPSVYLDYTTGSPTQGFYNLMSSLIEFEEYLVKNKIKAKDVFNHAMAQTYTKSFMNGLVGAESREWDK